MERGKGGGGVVLTGLSGSSDKFRVDAQGSQQSNTLEGESGAVQGYPGISLEMGDPPCREGVHDDYRGGDGWDRDAWRPRSLDEDFSGVENCRPPEDGAQSS